MLLEFLKQILSLKNAESDIDVQMWFGVAHWSHEEVTRTSLQFRIPHIDDELYYINHQLLAPYAKLVVPILSIWVESDII